MPLEALAPSPRAVHGAWGAALARLAAAWAALFALTWGAWREMAHQWWDIDTYGHILLIPPILGWLVWMRRDELAKVTPQAWWPGVGWTAAGCAVWLVGERLGINLIGQAGAVAALQGAVIALLGTRASLITAFPLLYAVFLVPFGDEIIAPLQAITAHIAVALTHASGVAAVIDGHFIDTPAGLFVVAEECSGVKFLIAMVALATLVAWTSFRSWRRRVVFVLAAAIASVLANGIRAWATIYVAQYVGAERAGGFDHIVYGWVFFALVIAAVLGAAWRFVEREPHDAGLSAEEADAIAARLPPHLVEPTLALALVLAVALVFAAVARLG